MHSPTVSESEPAREPCKRLVLAKGVVCDIELCPACNLFHVNIGATSLRLQPTALRDLADTLRLALAQYQRVALLRAQHAATPTPPHPDEMH